MTEDTTKAPTPETESSSTIALSVTEAATSKPSIPPLVACAYRLDRLLGATSTSTSTKPLPKAKEEQLLITNPAKIVRRWLGSSSGASSKATLQDIAAAAERVLSPSLESRGRSILLSLSSIDEGSTSSSMDTAEEKKDDSATPDPTTFKYLQVAHREVEAWLLSLAIKCLYQAKSYLEALTLSQTSIELLQAHLDGVSQTTTAKGSTVLHSPALFPLLARLYRYRALAAESHLGATHAATLYRTDLAHAHRTACLRRDTDTQSTILNLLLRDLLTSHQVEQAHKLLANSTFPETASNNQLCRYLYYSGQIQALRLEYTQAYSNLSTCLRKAPSNTALGFRIAVQRLWIVVQLLMGEIPDRTTLVQPHMRGELDPYLKITQAVRKGDLKVFEHTVGVYADQLVRDGTFTLISRLSHSVVKAGLRKLNASYSRISLEDVAQRLSLPSAASAEFVVAKAIRDGVIDATIDHAKQYVTSHELVDVYATVEPMEAFHRRIAYCLTTYNDAMRGMRYRADAYKRELEAMRGKGGGSGDEEKTDEEKAKELEDEFEDEF